MDESQKKLPSSSVIITSKASHVDENIVICRDRGGYRGGGYGNYGGGYGGGFYYTRSPFIWWDASDLLLLQGRRPRKPKNAPMSFLESIYSFVFGDGDPNQDYEERRWQMVNFFLLSASFFFYTISFSDEVITLSANRLITLVVKQGLN